MFVKSNKECVVHYVVLYNVQARKVFDDGAESLPGLIPARHRQQQSVHHHHLQHMCWTLYWFT